MGNVIFVIDRFGVLNAFASARASSSSTGWQSPDLVGFPNLNPGSPIASFAQSPTLYVVLTIDASGAVNVASYDTSTGWQGVNTVREASFVPGSDIEVFSPKLGANVATMMDQNGIFNAFSVDANNVWTGPDTYGSASFVPGSAIQARATSHANQRLRGRPQKLVPQRFYLRYEQRLERAGHYRELEFHLRAR